jgi:hypothetical protein
MMASRPKILLVLCALVLLPAPATRAADEGVCCDFSSNKKPLWQMVLDLPSAGSGDDCSWTYPAADIAYMDAQRIVAGFYMQCFHFKPHVPRIEMLDLLFQIDAASGKVLNRLELKSPPGPPNRIGGDFQILLMHDGRFLVRAGGVLKLLSPEFKEIRSRTLIEDNPSDWDYWLIRIAPGGRTGFFKRGKQSGSSEDHWFSTETLEDELVETAPREEDRLSSPVVTDTNVYFHIHGPKGLYVRERGQKTSRPLCPECTGVPIRFVSDGLLFLATSPRASFLLLRPQGNVAFQASYGTGVDYIFDITTASASPRFAFPFGHLQRGLFSWGSPESVVVFDAQVMKSVFQLKLKLQAVRMYGGEGWLKETIALSPDGKRLAVGSRAVLKVFDLSN